MVYSVPTTTATGDIVYVIILYYSERCASCYNYCELRWKFIHPAAARVHLAGRYVTGVGETRIRTRPPGDGIAGREKKTVRVVCTFLLFIFYFYSFPYLPLETFESVRRPKSAAVAR